MNNSNFMYFFIVELVIVAIIFITRLIFMLMKKHNLDKIIKSLTTKINIKNQDSDKFKECLQIIENNKNKINREGN